jgi:hypothetical protein
MSKGFLTAHLRSLTVYLMVYGCAEELSHKLMQVYSLLNGQAENYRQHFIRLLHNIAWNENENHPRCSVRYQKIHRLSLSP